MQALDTTIANVAMPYMQGSLSASLDQINWVLTSYIIASAIMTAPIASGIRRVAVAVGVGCPGISFVILYQIRLCRAYIADGSGPKARVRRAFRFGVTLNGRS